MAGRIEASRLKMAHTADNVLRLNGIDWRRYIYIYIYRRQSIARTSSLLPVNAVVSGYRMFIKAQRYKGIVQLPVVLCYIGSVVRPKINTGSDNVFER